MFLSEYNILVVFRLRVFSSDYALGFYRLKMSTDHMSFGVCIQPLSSGLCNQVLFSWLVTHEFSFSMHIGVSLNKIVWLSSVFVSFPLIRHSGFIV